MKKSCNPGKRGQVSIFIILGIVILLVAIIGSYLRNEAFREKVQITLFKSTVVPEQAQGLVNYVSNCILDITEEGVEKMGWQGGYVELPDEIKLNPENRFGNQKDYKGDKIIGYNVNPSDMLRVNKI